MKPHLGVRTPGRRREAPAKIFLIHPKEIDGQIIERPYMSSPGKRRGVSEPNQFHFEGGGNKVDEYGKLENKFIHYFLENKQENLWKDFERICHIQFYAVANRESQWNVSHMVKFETKIKRNPWLYF